jgi:hypothetical protein
MNKRLTLLEAYKKLPPFANQADLRNHANKRDNVWVTEDVDADVFDILLDQPEGKVLFRFNGKGRGEDVKFWKQYFEKTTGKEYLLKASDIPVCIIHCVANKSPQFLKVLAVAGVDKAAGKVHWIPFRTIEQFCQAANMSPMPTVYSGKMDYKQITGLANTAILGVPRRGIFVIPDDSPVKYIPIKSSVDEESLRTSIEPNIKTVISLSEEFARLAFDESEFMNDVQNEIDVDRFIKKITAKSIESTLMAEYIQRSKQEGGMEQQTSEPYMRDAIVSRCKQLAKKATLNV